MAGFLAEVKDKYNSLLTTNGIITVEMLKAVLKDKDGIVATQCTAAKPIAYHHIFRKNNRS